MSSIDTKRRDIAVRLMRAGYNCIAYLVLHAPDEAVAGLVREAERFVGPAGQVVDHG